MAKNVQRMDQAGLLDLQRSAARSAGVDIAFRDSARSGVPTPELVVIPPGELEIGSDATEFGRQEHEGPRRLVTLERPFALGRFTVTLEEWRAFEEATDHERWDWLVRPKTPRTPMFNIKPAGVRKYLEWLSEETGQRYRLPTEAEWEHACRAGTTTPFAFGEVVGCRDVHFNSLFPYEERRQRRKWYIPACFPLNRPLEVGSFQPNLWGLYDMHGNVQEFTATPWHDNHASLPRDGVYGPEPDNEWLVTKGGSWFDPAVLTRSAARRRRNADEMDTNLGFRVLRELEG
ncbi:formylglycine-generating enzyme family protein [Thioalkalivibrio sp. ALJ24]|uniref:formylglycine-generating enzyme family protein n=1 Tax=Thioalkalivibrio sp. ALJ24 TaxID=545276 RepID=UPI00039F9140|nr:formylglycine-generating enzyme family protein [Thioalkalivibrio sp. ALJ24]